MFRIAGCILALIGSVGFAGSVCKERTRRLKLLKQIKSIFENMKYYIAYQKDTIPEALGKLVQKTQAPFSEAFFKIYESVYEKGEMFPTVWKQCMETALREEPLTKEEKKLVFDFPGSLGFMEEDAQAGALDELLREVSIHMEELEREQKSKNKMTMSLGVAVGVMISILLL